VRLATPIVAAQHTYNPWFRLGLLLYVAAVFIWILGISAYSSLLVTAVLVGITVSGHYLLTWAGFRQLPIGVAFVLGVGLLVFLTQLLLFMGVPSTAANWGGIIVLGVGAVLSKRQSLDMHCTQLSSRSIDQFEAAFAVAVFVTATRQPWLMPFCCSLLVAIACARLVQTRLWMLLSSVLAVVVGSVSSLTIRPDSWWYLYQGNDSQFFEALSWSNSQWGVFEHPGFVGGSIAGYHWLTYAFFGSLSHLAGLGPWDGLMKVGSPLIVFAFASIFLGGISLKQSSNGRLHWLVAALCALTMPSIRVDSFAFSIVIAMAFVLTAFATSRAEHNWRVAVIFVVLAPTLIFGKVSTAAVVILVLALNVLIGRIRNESITSIPLLYLFGFLLVLSVTIFSNGADSSRLVDFSPSLSASLIEIRNLLDTASFTIQFCLLLAVLLYASRSLAPELKSLHFALIIATPLLTAVWIIQAGGTSGYFGQPGIFMLTLITAIRSNWAFEVLTATRVRIVMASILFGLFFAGYQYDSRLKQLNSQLNLSERLGEYWWEIVRGSGFVLVMCIVIVVIRSTTSHASTWLPPLTVVALLGFTAGTNVDYYQRIQASGVGQYLNRQNNSAPFAQSDLREIGSWIRKNTDSSIVLASNNFCCAGSDWWQLIEDNPTAHLNDVFGEAKWGGANYLLPAESRRRFLIQGLRFQTGYGEPSNDQIKRMSLSLNFANKPSPEVVAQLKFYGVSGYVTNLALTEHRDWSAYSVEKFRSGNFVYLEFK
jgi:hypothetical protein